MKFKERSITTLWGFLVLISGIILLVLNINGEITLGIGLGMIAGDNIMLEMRE